MANTTSSSYSGGCIINSSEEEEDMANCLIMLARGVSPVKSEKLKTRSVTEMAAGENYKCKTCNRSFPSFQALGEHRASHKKPKVTVDDQNQPNQAVLYEENKAISTNKSLSPMTPNQYKTSQTKVHQCSICGSEFLSGQALGGHMRRHRTTGQPSVCPTKAKPLNEKSPVVLSLDLNLPPPEVIDDGHSSFQFLSAAALVDCHY
ncbi:zinc finger protein ZAT5-like [Bidens hawaiensis]|uniref:zinc finger protein ZAT5-like n=1 Tax=Bidens hawaiensis TaxID=980011 RepID=UPI00404A5EB9